tara:strand:- start:491 stop:949 length:459 start_codon:yes stop_codon:yes gene_type:complete
MAEEKYLKSYSKSALGNYLVSHRGVKQNCITFTGTASVTDLTLKDEDSGSTVFLNGTGAASTITMPAQAAGLEFDFVCTADSGAHDIVIAGLFDGFVLDAGAVTDLADATASITLVASKIVVGDRFKCISNGTKWIVSGSFLTDAAVTAQDA